MFNTDYAPVYDDILILGASNSAWTPQQLSSMSNQNFLDSLDILGSIRTWDAKQVTALKDKLTMVKVIHDVLSIY